MKTGAEIYDDVRGNYLVARLGTGGIFSRSVVWMAEFERGVGARGVIVNLKMDKTLGHCVPSYAGTPMANVPVFIGGPVDPERISFLIRSAITIKGAFPLGEKKVGGDTVPVGTAETESNADSDGGNESDGNAAEPDDGDNDDDDGDALGGSFTMQYGVFSDEILRGAVLKPDVRVYGFAGCAEWAPGQLENELLHGFWYIAKAGGEYWEQLASGRDFWRRMMRKVKTPDAELMSFAPDNLAQN